jgi:glycosyltransferase involved in cell wall biosynthesis
MHKPLRVKIVSPFWLNLPQIAVIDNFLFALLRTFLLNAWTGILARIFLRGSGFEKLVFYHPQFAFMPTFLRSERSSVTVYDKADAYPIFYAGAVRRAVSFLDEYNTRQADIVLAASPQLETLAKRQHARRTLEVDNGVYLSDFNHSMERDRDVAVYVGNLTDQRWGVDLMLRAVPRVVEEFPNFRVRIVGEGPLRSKLYSLSKHLAVAEHVHFEGHIPHEKIGKITCASRVAVVPYRPWTGFRFATLSLKVLEYLASGTPVVATNVGPFATLVGLEKLGAVVEPTPEGIASGIISILRLSKTEWCAMSERTLKIAHEHDWDTQLSEALGEVEKVWLSKRKMNTIA